MTNNYFSFIEMIRTDTGIENIPNWEQIANLQALIKHVLNPVRELHGKPIYVTSGYRSPAVNKAVGGVRNSQHLCRDTSSAADITTLSIEENRKVFELIKKHTFFDQLKLSKGGSFIHVSFNYGKNRLQVIE